MKSIRLLTVIAFLTLGLVSRGASSLTVLSGSVTEVIDGETITVNVDNRLVKVRLCAVTAPKKSHALAEVARSHLALLTRGKIIQIEYKGLDHEGSIIGVVTLDEVDIGLQMIRDGAALYNRAYENDVPIQSRHLYEESEQAARDEARGIWQGPLKPSVAELEGGGEISSESGTSASEIAIKLNNDAYSLINRDNYKTALPKVREALRLDPSLADAHKNLALIFCDTGRYQEALPEAREAIRLKSDSDKAHNVLGKILLGMRDYEAAIREFNESVRLNPSYAKAFYNLGVTFERSGQLRKSLTAYHQAEMLTPTVADIQLNIGLVLYKLGNRSEARTRWKKVLTMGDPVAAMMAEENLAHFSF